MKNVFVFPCGSEIGLEINRALANSIHFNLFGGSSVDDHGKYVYKNYIDNVPYINSPNFIDALNEIIRQHEIDFVIPAHDTAIIKLAENQSQINAMVVTSPLETCRICNSKAKTYELFKNHIPTPEVFENEKQLNYPVFLKPDVGQGSKGTYKVKNEEELTFYLKKDPTILILEYLPGKEYTIDCFTDRNGNLLFVGGRERVRIKSGISVNSKIVENAAFRQIAEKINSILPLQGVWFYQLKERGNGEFVLMEIAPRIAGTMALYRGVGINFIQLSLFDRMGYDVSVLNNHFEIEIDRALISRFALNVEYDFVYVDFDDTIIINNTVNAELIRFLYQAKNSGKKIILITKHIYDINETLSKYAISSLLFEEIIVIERSQNKSSYIKHKKSIFIDDSFAERKEVNESLKIPVFGIDAIESLLYWKV